MHKKYYILTSIACCLLVQSCFAANALDFGAVVKPFIKNTTRDHRIQAYENFTSQLSKKSGMPVKFIPFDTYTKMDQALDTGHIDMAYGKSSQYALAKIIEKKPIQAIGIVLITENGRQIDHYNAHILTINPELKTLKSLRNKTYAFNGSYISASGIVYPNAYIYKKTHMTLPQYFSMVYRTNGSDGAMRHLMQGHADAIGSWDDSFTGNKHESKKYHMIADIPNLPNPPIIANTHLPKKILNRVSAALVKLPKSAFKGLTFNGVEKKKPNFYNQCAKYIQLLLTMNPKFMKEIDTMKQAK
jgi:ABC-type phosphate/phosphonate transport system substrate-binding protein